MLSLVEKFAVSIRRMQSDADARAVLQQIAAEFGYNSAFLIEGDPASGVLHTIIDTNLDRQSAWRDLLLTKGSQPGLQLIRSLMGEERVLTLTPDRFPPNHPYEPFAKRWDMGYGNSVPVLQGDDVAGQVMFFGKVDIDKRVAGALLLLGYQLFSQIRAIRARQGPSPAELPRLTPREKDVMRLSAIGLTSTEIADRLGMSPRTVNQHVDNVADKLGTRNRTHTIAELVRNDMLE